MIIFRMNLCFLLLFGVCVAFQFDAIALYNNTYRWQYGPAPLRIVKCTNVSVRVVSETSKCCDAALLTNSSCRGCTDQNRNQCFVSGESTTFGFKEHMASSCANETYLELKCLACQPGSCLNKDHTAATTTVLVSPATNKHTKPLTHLTEYSTTQTSSAQQPSSVTPSIEVTVSSSAPRSRTGEGTISSRTSPPVTSVLSSPEMLSTILTTLSANVSEIPNAIDNSTFNETSTEQPFDLEQSKQNLYAFLAALGASLLVVLIIVCVFFFRKSRSKLPIVSISEEFWSSRDYIADIDDEDQFCGPGVSYNVIKPVINTKSYTTCKSFLKNEETASPSYIKTEAFCPSYTSYSPQDDNAFRLETVARNSTTKEPVCSTDDEAGVVMDLTKIVANEIKSQQQRTRTIEDRKIITDKTTRRPSNGHYRKGKHHRESRQRMRPGQRIEDSASQRGQANTDDMYAVSYKSKIHDYLEQCSAEESDV